MRYLEEFPDTMQSYITSIVDVADDGNCGYRAIAALMGMGENNFMVIRRDVLDELALNRQLYTRLHGGVDEYEKIYHAIDYFSSNAPFENWMSILDIGYLIATRYNIVLYHFSRQICLTFLPL